MKLTNLGELRALVEYLEGQPDSVPVRLSVDLPGLGVRTGSFPSGSQLASLTVHASASVARVGQSSGYLHNMGPAAYILIEGIPS